MGVIEIIVAALASGAAAGLKPTVEQTVKDAYAGLKGLIARKYSGVDLAALEKRPDSQVKRDSVAEDLTAAGVAGDAEMLAHARSLLDAIAAYAPEAASAIGVDLAQIRGAALRIQDVEALDTGVRVRDSEFAGDIDISKVRAGVTGDHPKND